MTENPNTVTVTPSKFGRSSRRTGNRIDRIAERLWLTRQAIAFPIAPVCMMLSALRTYYVRASLLGAIYMLAHLQIIVPGTVLFLLGAFLAWELIVGAYLFTNREIPKFDLMLRIFISLVGAALTYYQLFQGFCYAPN